MITGTTKVCYVVADPIKQVRTPAALNEIWDSAGRDIISVPAHVSAAGLSEFIAGIRANESVLGAVVTVPHKQAAVGLCDELGPNARVVGAVNVIRRAHDGSLVGETFDGLGFVSGLRSEGIDPEGKRVVVFGAGGAASAVAVALLSANARTVDISNRTPSRAMDLVERLRTAFPADDIRAGLDRLADTDLIVNATSSGMNGSTDSPMDGIDFPVGAIAADVVMSAELTPFLAGASAQGNRTHAGAHMLAGQARLIADYLAGPREN